MVRHRRDEKRATLSGHSAGVDESCVQKGDNGSRDSKSIHDGVSSGAKGRDECSVRGWAIEVAKYFTIEISTTEQNSSRRC